MDPLVKNRIGSESHALLRAVYLSSIMNLRIGIIAALLGMLTVFLFRPGTSPDETAVFVLVPITVLLAFARVLVAIVTRIDLPPSSVQPEAAVKFLSWLAVIAILAFFVGISSLFAYKALGLMWAVDFAFRILLVLFAIIVLAVLCVGMHLTMVYQSGVQLLKTVIPSKLGTRRISLHF